MPGKALMISAQPYIFIIIYYILVLFFQYSLNPNKAGLFEVSFFWREESQL